MHELAVTQGLLDIALSEAEKYHAKKVVEIKIAVGEMAGLVPQYIQEYFDIVSEGTVAHKATLTFRTIPSMIRCKDCGAETHMKRVRFRCEACDSNRVELISGKEFFVESLEIED